MEEKLTRAQALVKMRMGRHWRRRLDAALCTLADAEGALILVVHNGHGKVRDVCEGLRHLIDD